MTKDRPTGSPPAGQAQTAEAHAPASRPRGANATAAAAEAFAAPVDHQGKPAFTIFATPEEAQSASLTGKAVAVDATRWPTDLPHTVTAEQSAAYAALEHAYSNFAK